MGDWQEAGRDLFGVLHGDYRLDNLMFPTSGSGVVIKDNDLHVLSTTGDSAIRSISATVNGVIARNNIRLTEDLTAPNGVILAGGTWLVYDNRVSAGNGFAVQTPATDS